MRTRSRAAPALTLVSLPDDAFLLVIAACEPKTFRNVQGYLVEETKFDVPLLKEVMGLGCVSKGMRQQLHRLQPLVGVESLAVVQRPAHGPWRVTLLYDGTLAEAVVEQAQQGRVRSISVASQKRGPYSKETAHVVAPAVARRVVPDLLGAGCSLLYLDLSFSKLNSTWAACFSEAAVCSPMLRWMRLKNCGLWGPLPELRLPALQKLDLSHNDHLTGGLEPLRGCTALLELDLCYNKLSGELEPLRSCTALQQLLLQSNQLTGGLEPLRGCMALEVLAVGANELTGGLSALRSCTALSSIDLNSNNLTGGLEPLRGCTALAVITLYDSPELTGGLEPLRGFSASLESLEFENTQLIPSAEDVAHFENFELLEIAGGREKYVPGPNTVVFV